MSAYAKHTHRIPRDLIPNPVGEGEGGRSLYLNVFSRALVALEKRLCVCECVCECVCVCVCVLDIFKAFSHALISLAFMHCNFLFLQNV